MLPSNDSGDVDRLVSRLRELGELGARPAWGRASASCDHIGAKLSDAVLQSGVGYEAFVRRRVERVTTLYPAACTTSGFLELLRGLGPAKLLEVSAGRKLRTIVELTEFLAEHRIETVAELREWLQVPGNRERLLELHGVGPKTVSFLKLLVGLDAVAVDMHIRRFVEQAGVTQRDPAQIEALLISAGRKIGLSGSEVDELVWRSMAARGRRGKTTRAAT